MNVQLLFQYGNKYCVQLQDLIEVCDITKLSNYLNNLQCNYYIRMGKPVLKKGKLLYLKENAINISKAKEIPNIDCVMHVNQFFYAILPEIDFADADVQRVLATIDNATVNDAGTFLQNAYGVYPVENMSTGAKVILIALWARKRQRLICLNCVECGMNALQMLFTLCYTFPIILCNNQMSIPKVDMCDYYEVVI